MDKFIEIKKIITNRIYLSVALFLLLTTIFSWVFLRWVREDMNKESVDEKLKRELTKNPINSKLASNASTGQVKGTAQSSSSSSMPSQTPDASPNASSVSSPPTTVQEMTSPSPSDTSEDSLAQEVEEKQTFKSDKLKVSLEYTEEIVVTEGDNYLIVSQKGVTWKIKVYSNKEKGDINTWFGDYYPKKDNPNCSFSDGTVKVGTYESKSIKANLETEKCENAGNYAISSDKSKVVKIDVGKETVENVNKILTGFKFLD